MRNFFKKLRSDSWSKYFSKTVQRVGKNNAGFSLVELIVVIAIMAVLAAVAVIGVSIYIPKAQKAADEQMIADIKTAVGLYANLEPVAPGQSGYIVIHKNKGTGETGNVSVGGAMDGFLTEALKSTFGEKYGTELKVSYDGWTGTLSAGSAGAIVDSSYAKDPSSFMNDIQNLTDALSGFYGGNDKLANQATLDVAYASVHYINSDALQAWWCSGSFVPEQDLLAPDGTPVFNIPDEVLQNPANSNYKLKLVLATQIARVSAFVNATQCPGCMEAYNSGSDAFHEVSNDPQQALTAVGKVAENLTNHIVGDSTKGILPCDRCAGYVDTASQDSYWNTQAPLDAAGYIPIMEQIDNMSDTIKENEAFSSGGLFKSDFITNTVSGFMSAADAFNSETNPAQDGDLVIVAIVNSNGDLVYQIYPNDFN